MRRRDDESDETTRATLGSRRSIDDDANEESVTDGWVFCERLPRSANAQKALDNYDERSRALPQLRYELLEDLSRRKLALEKKIDAATAPREQARRQTLKDVMRKTDASEREGRDVASS